MFKAHITLCIILVAYAVVQPSYQTATHIYVPTTQFIENGQKMGISAWEILTELHDSLDQKPKAQDVTFLNTRLAILYFINGIILECLTGQVFNLLPDAKKDAQRVQEELTHEPAHRVYISPAFKGVKIASPEIIAKFRSAAVQLEKLKELVYKFILCEDFANFFELSGKEPALAVNKDFDTTRLNQYLKFVEPAIGILLTLEKSPVEKRADLEAIITELKKSHIGVKAKQYKRFLQVIDEALPPTKIVTIPQKTGPIAHTRYLVRSDMPSQAGYKAFNDLLPELTKQAESASITASQGKQFKLRLATLFVINDRIVDCLTDQVAMQLTKSKTDSSDKAAAQQKKDQVTDIEKQKIKEELTRPNPKDPLYIESKFIRNKKAQQEDYTQLTSAGINLALIKELVDKAIPCDFFNNIVESRLSTWAFGGAQFYLRENIITYLNRYLMLTEEAIRALVSDESIETKKNNIAQLTEKVASMKIGNSKLEKEMLETFTSVMNSEFQKQMTGQNITADKKEATSIDQLLLFSLSLNAIKA